MRGVRTRQSICNRKKRFGSRGDALAAGRRSGLWLLPYRCDRCRRFHLTSRTKGKGFGRAGAIASPSKPDSGTPASAAEAPDQRPHRGL
ncbi:MAG TPA: hypothetical protein VEZ70_07405 [Allosphingosinicella sp.]|nr:hypothetical protein [Allosphingosinicella sp.]